MTLLQIAVSLIVASGIAGITGIAIDSKASFNSGRFILEILLLAASLLSFGIGVLLLLASAFIQ